jgi:hypothetical protein
VNTHPGLNSGIKFEGFKVITKYQICNTEPIPVAMFSMLPNTFLCLYLSGNDIDTKPQMLKTLLALEP